MVFVEVGSPYILAGAQTEFLCRSVWHILHWIVYYKEKRMIVLGVCKKKY